MSARVTLSPVTAAAHEHAWVTESMHATSEGRVRYVRCTGCRARRVDLDSAVATPPVPLSREV
ncbi:MAG: hypothetical protein IJO71_12115 [Microbacterium sp.]|jgi:hypothetical protein|uniref:hypothetical protein n=1 Tax=Microbacterium sp. TaxID=51671 RepID=UPI0025E0B6F6|nr:hypothetical protein [Microbacterium sp.]MBQ9917926.1 hypothetical protein [Microbacterium sp.]